MMLPVMSKSPLCKVLPPSFKLSSLSLTQSSKHFDQIDDGNKKLHDLTCNFFLFSLQRGTASGKYTWTVPKDTPNGADYTVAFGSAPTYYYSRKWKSTIMVQVSQI